MDDAECGLEVVLAIVGGKWKLLILYHLKKGPRRFGDLKRLVAGISEKVLIQQLRDLQEAGVLVRHDYKEVPPRVDYTVTPFGMTLVEALAPLCSWGTENRAEVTRRLSEGAREGSGGASGSPRADTRDGIADPTRPGAVKSP